MTQTPPPRTVRMSKLSIGSLDKSDLQVTAQYNPAQLETGRTSAWKQHGNDNRPARLKYAQRANELEYTGGENRTLTIELLFDNYETGICVEPTLEALDEMASVIEPTSSSKDQRRPHHCVVVWGDGGIKPMPCVIESVTTKYTMFARNGQPLRATATLKVREVGYAKAIDRKGSYVEVVDRRADLDGLDLRSIVE